MVIFGKAYWAAIKVPNTKFEPVYTIDLVPDDPTVLEDFKDKGFKTKTTPDGEEALVIKRKVEGMRGPNKVPKLVDASKNPIDVQVGNGSQVAVQCKEYSGKNSYGPYQGLDLQAVQVLDLIEYAQADGAEFEDFDPESEL